MQERTPDEVLQLISDEGAEVVDVTIPDLDSLLAGSGVSPLEFKWDLMDYLAKSPGAPMRERSVSKNCMSR